MTRNSDKPKAALGFLTVVEDSQHGLFGGYLLLNPAGRPLEFHCTAPIKPNRAQQILYGPTLVPFLYGEQIGGTLLGQAKTEPLLVLTDCEPVLAVRDLGSLPVALVTPPGSETPGGARVENAQPLIGAGSLGVDAGSLSVSATGEPKAFRLDGAHRNGPQLTLFRIGRNRLAVPQRWEDDRHLIVERLRDLVESFDLNEPFARIREAITEAQQAAR